jgi:hypothetical protein
MRRDVRAHRMRQGRATGQSADVGEWRAQAMASLVTQDGSVAYQRIKGGVTTSLNAPLRRFEGDNFVHLRGVEAAVRGGEPLEGGRGRRRADQGPVSEPSIRRPLG